MSDAVHDVIIVGSGAGGGMSTYVLTQAGLKVLLIEAGRDYDPITETPMFNTPAQAPLRATATPDKPEGFYDATVDGGYSVPNEPYSVAEGSEFLWWRDGELSSRDGSGTGDSGAAVQAQDWRPQSNACPRKAWTVHASPRLSGFRRSRVGITSLKLWPEPRPKVLLR